MSETNNNTSNQQILLHDYAIPFAAWELRLYLNSHPNDHRALRLYHDLATQSACGNYASIYLDCPSECEAQGDNGSALDYMDYAACPLTGNLDDMDETDGCCCDYQEGDCCPLTWAWLEGPWPWEGNCPRCGN